MNWIVKKIGSRPKSFFLSICWGWGGFWWMAPIPLPPFHVFLLPRLKTKRGSEHIFYVPQIFVLLSLALLHCNCTHFPFFFTIYIRTVAPEICSLHLAPFFLQLTHNSNLTTTHIRQQAILIMKHKYHAIIKYITPTNWEPTIKQKPPKHQLIAYDIQFEANFS